MDDDEGDRNETKICHDEDYYAFLNIPKTASAEDVRNAFKVLSRRFHPDKHSDPALKHEAELMFNKLKKIYDVLSDPQKRSIYDTLGVSGIETDGWALIEKKYRNANEIKEEYERLLKEKEERRLQQRTNPKGTITVLIDGTDLFEKYDSGIDVDEDDSGFSFPSVEVRSMTISQSIEAPITADDNVILGGNINVRNGVGTGTVSASLRHIFSPTTWGELEFGAGQGPLISLKGYRSITSDLHANVQTIFHVTPFGIRPAIVFSLTRQFSKHFIGYLTWKAGIDSALSSVLVYENEFFRVNGLLQLSIRNSFISSSYTHKFKEKDTRVKVGLRLGMLGAFLEYGGETKISEHSVLGASMSIGTLSGVSLKIKLNRSSQNYIFPIVLSEQLIPSSIFYGTVVPLLSFYAVKSFFIDPYLQKKDQEEFEIKKQENASQIAAKIREANAYISLMQETYIRIVEREQQYNGLLIERAIYGDEAVLFEYEDNNRPIPTTKNAFDVTVALQVMVNEHSNLILAATSKSHLPGFFDTNFGGPKKLLIRYLFHGAYYRALLGESEGATLPSNSHRVVVQDQQF